MEYPRLAAGQRLRVLREQKELTIREVETASMRLATKYGNEDYYIPLSRLSDIETKGVVPNIFKLYSLAAIYRVSFAELVAQYGVDPDNAGFETDLVQHAKTHTVPAKLTLQAVDIPTKLDPSFKLAKTSNLGRMIEKWGALPFAYLAQLADSDYTYGYIGMEDFTMYPLIVPGSFIQVDEHKNKIVEKAWRSEYERPIYFIETREGHTCSWCSLKGDQLILQPHPLSPVPPRILKHTHEAEVIGQVVGLAMQLGEWRPMSGKDTPGPRELN
jgi:transcriptional regulator with XRE-family HTH domain